MKTLKFYGFLAIAAFLISACDRKKDELEEPVKPKVEIVSVDEVKPNRIRFTCKVVSHGTSQVNVKGVCYNDNPNPTTLDSQVMTNDLKDEYEILISGLNSNTTYYFRAFANSKAGMSYSEDLEVTTHPSTTSPYIGQTGPGGGIIFYDKGMVSDGWQFMEVTLNDQNKEEIWGCDNQVVNTQPEIGFGLMNTNNFVGKCNQGAAYQCANFYLGGYNDWYLPSRDELELMYLYLHKSAMGGFLKKDYWSSTEAQDPNKALTHAVAINFSNGTTKEVGKNVKLTYRAVRRF